MLKKSLRAKRIFFATSLLVWGFMYAPGLRAEEDIQTTVTNGFQQTKSQPPKKSYEQFLKDIRKEALQKHLASAATLNTALSFAEKRDHPSQKIIQQDRNQPEFHWTWTIYKNHVLSAPRLKQGKIQWAAESRFLRQVSKQYHVDPHVILGIWGIESHFGEVEGKHNVFEALATLAYDGRRADFFRKELLTAISIAGKGDIKPEKMTSSYAGAMGQTQFMPTAYMHFATTGHKKTFFHRRSPNIWKNKQDVLFSIANYMQKSGWDPKMPWGEAVKISQFTEGDPTFKGTDNYSTAPRHTLAEWEKLGIYPLSGGHFSYPGQTGILFQPEGPKGESFMLYPNFRVIMRYNPSEFYALAAALLGDLSGS